MEPASVAEALSLLASYGGRARALAGGTDLLVQIRNKAVKLEYVIDISLIPGLGYIRFDDKNGLALGALTTVRSLERSAELQQRYPVLSQAAGQLGSMAIRNVATIGGNLCNAAPSAENAPSLLGLDARVKIIGPESERTMPLEDFFTGPGKTALRPGELLTEIQVPPPAPHTRGVYLKHSIRGSIDLAITGVAAIVTLDGRVCRDVKIALGAVAPTPLRARKAEEVLRGEKVTPALVEKAAAAAAEQCRPISDVRASAEYRREMVRVLTRLALTRALAEPGEA